MVLGGDRGDDGEDSEVCGGFEKKKVIRSKKGLKGLARVKISRHIMYSYTSFLFLISVYLKMELNFKIYL